MQDYMLDVKSRGLAKVTQENYEFVIGAFLKTLTVDIAEVTPSMIKEYIASKDSLALSTKRVWIRILNAFFFYLVENDYLERNPIQKIKNVPLNQ
jgi:site-specific recombinase XerD